MPKVHGKPSSRILFRELRPPPKPRGDDHGPSPALYAGVAVFILIIGLICLGYSYLARPGPFQVFRKWLRLPTRTRTTISHYPIVTETSSSQETTISLPHNETSSKDSLPRYQHQPNFSAEVLHATSLLQDEDGIFSSDRDSKASSSSSPPSPPTSSDRVHDRTKREDGKQIKPNGAPGRASNSAESIRSSVVSAQNSQNKVED